MSVKGLSRRDVLAMVTRSHLDLLAARDDCAAQAQAAQAQASGACRAERSTVAALHERRREAYGQARGSFGRAQRACAPSVESAKANAPKGQRRAAGKAARGACRLAARTDEARAYGTYYRAREAHEGAKDTRKATCDAAKGVRRATYRECIEPALEKHATERRRADRLEAERREDAKRARGGRRQPVSPGERRAEEIDRARNDLEAFDDGARALFEERVGWFVQQWAAARKRGRKISLAEFVGWYAEEHPDQVAEAQERAADAWVAEQWAKYEREAA